MDQPAASSTVPSACIPNFWTSGRVRPWTTNAVAMAAKKRYDEIVVRSLESAVMTPVSAEYGTLFMV